MAGQGDGVSGDLTRIDLAEPQPHLQTSVTQPGEEPRLIMCLPGRLGHDVPEHRASDRDWHLLPQEMAVRSCRCTPACPQLRQRQVGGELPAAVPDHRTVPGRVAGKTNRIPCHFTWIGDAVALADEHPGLLEPREELLLRARPGRRRAHLPAQRGPGRLIPPAPDRLLRLGARGPLGRGAIRRSGRPQPKPPLRIVASFPDPEKVVPDPRPRSVLAGQRRHNMHMIGGVAHRHPPHPQIIPLWRQPSPVHYPRRDLCPLRIRQHPVIRRRPHRAMPHRLAVTPPTLRRQWHLQQPGQAPEVPRSSGTAFRLQIPRISEPGDQVRIAVLIRLARTVQVIQQPPDITAPEHFPNQRHTPAPLTEHFGAIVLLPRPAAGSPAHKNAPPEPNPHPAAPSHSAAPPPDSNSCRSAAPARPPPSTPLRPPALAPPLCPEHHAQPLTQLPPRRPPVPALTGPRQR